MENQNYMDQFKSPKEFIQHEICSNRGSQNVIKKSDLTVLVRSFGIEVDERKMTKADMYLLLKDAISIEKIANHCLHLGVSSYSFQQKFDVTNAEVKRMARLGFIQVTGSKRIRMYGKYRNADLYSIFDYFRLTKNEVGAWLVSHPKGSRSQ